MSHTNIWIFFGVLLLCALIFCAVLIAYLRARNTEGENALVDEMAAWVDDFQAKRKRILLQYIQNENARGLLSKEDPLEVIYAFSIIEVLSSAIATCLAVFPGQNSNEDIENAGVAVLRDIPISLVLSDADRALEEVEQCESSWHNDMEGRVVEYLRGSAGKFSCSPECFGALVSIIQKPSSGAVFEAAARQLLELSESQDPVADVSNQRNRLPVRELINNSQNIVDIATEEATQLFAGESLFQMFRNIKA